MLTPNGVMSALTCAVMFVEPGPAKAVREMTLYGLPAVGVKIIKGEELDCTGTEKLPCPSIVETVLTVPTVADTEPLA
jgi:hypothetical protein